MVNKTKTSEDVGTLRRAKLVTQNESCELIEPRDFKSSETNEPGDNSEPSGKTE